MAVVAVLPGDVKRLDMGNTLLRFNNDNWQQLASQCITDIDVLCNELQLDAKDIRALCEPNAFALKVPLPFVSRIQKGDATDPLLLQILPLKQEKLETVGFVADPLGETSFNPTPGLIHKYAGRVLLTMASSCPVNCRYCFRRHFPYADNRLTPATWQPALDYIEADASISEIILSGGEPLLLNDRMIDKLLHSLEKIEHVKLLRIHSRMPIVIPQRLTKALCDRLSSSRLRTTLVLHCNHPNEIDSTVSEALAALVASPVTLLNQSVLLKNINDTSAVLKKLSYTLFDVGVLPYYLHATDPVQGTAHFFVDDTRAKALSKQLINSLPGYLVPTLVREISGESAKTRLGI